MFLFEEIGAVSWPLVFECVGVFGESSLYIGNCYTTILFSIYINITALLDEIVINFKAFNWSMYE